MKSWKSGFQVAVLAMGVTGCSAVKDSLDMRCQDVSERVRMHQGSPWYLNKPVLVGSKLRNDAGGESNYCSLRKGGKSSMTEQTDAHEGSNDAGMTASLIAPYVDDHVCLWKEKPPAPKDPQSAELAKQKYLDKHEVYLSSEGIHIGEDLGDVSLYLANETLNCAPAGKYIASQWRCQQLEPRANPGAPDSVLEKCFENRRHDYTLETNYVGVIADRYCLYVSVLEEKSAKIMDLGQPTSINRDQLLVELNCVEYKGPRPAGVIVGGPHPEFTMPSTPVRSVD